MKDNYRQGDRVKILPNSSIIEGLGIICGVSVNGISVLGKAVLGKAVLGKGWIVKPDKQIEGYEYSHVVLFSNMLEPFYDIDHPRYIVLSFVYENIATQHLIYDNKESYYVHKNAYNTNCKEDADTFCRSLN